MSLASILPAPKNTRDKPIVHHVPIVTHNKVKDVIVPPYGSRHKYLPRTPDDFGDGGAFPEIHRLQYPLDMGNKRSNSSKALAVVSIDSSGNADYSAVVTQNIRKEQRVFHDYKDLIPSNPTLDELQKPKPETVEENTQKTREALEKLVKGKIAAAQPRKQPTKAVGEPVYVRYQPSRIGTHIKTEGVEQRIVRMHEMPVDPMEPAKFKFKKAPAGPPSPPVPIMHSPPRKISMADQQNWKIPPCVSNWKNIKGYTIAADKRLAADGRGLVETQINDKFASFSESMYLAERIAREELEQRRQMQKAVDTKARDMKEDELRKLASDAREKRAGLEKRVRQSESYEDATMNEATVDEVVDREEARRDMRRDARRDLRMSHMGTQARKSKMERDSNRDVSEQIALGKQVKASADSLFDQRLFNQSQGMSQGFGADDSYTTFDKPLFSHGQSAQHVYRPRGDNVDTSVYGTRNDDGDDMHDIVTKSAARFQPDTGFKGAESTRETRQSGGRKEPVQFEHGRVDTLHDDDGGGDDDDDDGVAAAAATATHDDDDDDPFGLDAFVTRAKTSNALNRIGTTGFMSAAAGAAVAGDDGGRGGGGKRGEVAFTAAAANDDDDATSSHQMKQTSTVSSKRNNEDDDDEDDDEMERSRYERRRRHSITPPPPAAAARSTTPQRHHHHRRRRSRSRSRTPLRYRRRRRRRTSRSRSSSRRPRRRSRSSEARSRYSR